MVCFPKDESHLFTGVNKPGSQGSEAHRERGRMFEYVEVGGNFHHSVFSLSLHPPIFNIAQPPSLCLPFLNLHLSGPFS